MRLGNPDQPIIKAFNRDNGELESVNTCGCSIQVNLLPSGTVKIRIQASCLGIGQAASGKEVQVNRMRISPANVPYEKIKALIKEHRGIVPA